MAIHINGQGQTSNVNINNLPKGEQVEEKDKAYSIFDVNQDGKVDTDEQMKQVKIRHPLSAAI